MGARRNLNRWVLISVSLLAIVGTSAANAETINRVVYQSKSSLATTANDPNGPRILSCNISTLNEQGTYYISCSADVNDPQGLDDIAIVKGNDANGNEFIFEYGAVGTHGYRYYANHSYGSITPPLGDFQIVAIDQSGNSDTVTRQTIILDLPAILFPKENESIFETQPVFDWADVSDEDSTVTYSIFVYIYHGDSLEKIWDARHLKDSEALFNFDDTANEPLQYGMFYFWEVSAIDIYENSSYYCGYFAVIAQDSNEPTIISSAIQTYHGLDDHCRDGYAMDVRAEVHDPQGPNDIATVKVIDANGNEFILDHTVSWSYYHRQIYGSIPPPLGNLQIVAIDQSGNSDTVNKNLANVIEELSTMLFPKENEVITETQPVFDWTDVTDAEYPITYSIYVYHQDFSTMIWRAVNLKESEVQFAAAEPLQDGKSYWWELRAHDTLGNESGAYGSFQVGTPIVLENLIILENDYLQIELHPSRPYVYRYVSKINGEVIYGDIVNTEFVAQIFYEGTLRDVKPSVERLTQESDRICYHMKAEVESNLAVTFDLCYRLNGNTVGVVFNNVEESPDYLLVFVRSPDLLTIRGTQPGAKLVFPESEGRLIDVESACAGHEVIDFDPSAFTRPLLAAMLYHDSLIGVAHYDHLDMTLWVRVIGCSSESRLATIGMTFNYRYAPTNFSNAAFIDVFDEVTRELTVDLTFLADYDGDVDVDWMDGAKFLRDQVQVTPDPRYLSSFIAFLWPSGLGLITDHLRAIRELYYLTDHNRAYCYLAIYNHLVPQVFGVEGDIMPEWPYEDLLRLFQEAEESYNTFLGFNDDYTHQLPGTDVYDPNLNVIKEDGTPEGFSVTIPGFDVVFRMDPYDYATTMGIDRVRNTLERYPIKKCHHMDSLSVLFPKDHSLSSPSSRERNRRGVQLIVDEFDKFGVNVTSEGLTGQYVQSGIGFFLNSPRWFSPSYSFGNQECIPLLAFICHGKTLYGLHEGNFSDLPCAQAQVYASLEPLLLGANSGAQINNRGIYDLEIDKFYLIDLPWMALNQRFMQDYQEQGSRRRITYDADTFVEVDYEQDTYTVQVDGRIIAENYTTCFPKTENKFLIFSRDAKQISVTLPKKWLAQDRGIIQLHALTEDGLGDAIPFQISFGNLTFQAGAYTPYRLDLIVSGDFDFSSSVDMADFAIFASAWLTEQGEPQHNPLCDIAIPPDNYIDWRDLDVLVDNWLTGAE